MLRGPDIVLLFTTSVVRFDILINTEAREHLKYNRRAIYPIEVVHDASHSIKNSLTRQAS